MKVVEVLDSNKLQYRLSGNNYSLDCPFCDDDRGRLGIRKEGSDGLTPWNCFNCNAKGKTLKTFIKKLEGNEGKKLNFKIRKQKENPDVNIDSTLILKYRKRLRKFGNVLQFLKDERGFTNSAINHFKLGSKTRNGNDHLAIPFYEDNKLVNIKFRALEYESKKFKWHRITGGKSSLFNDEVIDDLSYDSIYITEAELDCVALWNAGRKNVISVTTGAKGFQSEWFDRLARFKKIFLVFDNDIAGQEGALGIAKRLGLDRCRNIILPNVVKDLNEYFWNKEENCKRFSLIDFKGLVKDSKHFSIPDVVSLSEAYSELYKDQFLSNEDEIIGLTTPWDNVNRLFKGARPGHLVVLCAAPKCGKTTFAINWMVALAKEDISCFMYCCEMRQKVIAEKTIMMEIPELASYGSLDETMIKEANYKMPSHKIHLAYPKMDALTLDKVCEKITEVVQRYGCKLVCFDNLHFLVRGTDSVKDKIGEITRRFKLLAENLEIVFVLITHPRKIPNDKAPTANDLKDSSSIFQDLDTLFILHRNKKGADALDPDSVGVFEALTSVDVTSRYSEGGKTHLYFKGNRALFKNSGKDYERAITAMKNKFKGKKGRKF